MSKYTDIVATLADDFDLKSPDVVNDIDQVLVHLLNLRRFAAELHGVTTPAPVMGATRSMFQSGPAVGALNTVAAIKTDEAVPVEVKGAPVNLEHLTVKQLIAAYKTDPDSGYQKLRFRTRENYDSLLRRIEKDLGPEMVSELDGRRLKRQHEKWREGGHVAMAHALMTNLRTLATFGSTWLKNSDCRELKMTLSGMEFEMPAPRGERLTAEHARAIRRSAHKLGYPSLGLAQAFQFDTSLKQKDVIGEWTPFSEPGTSDVIDGDLKWLRGIRWNEIDDDLILRHVTSKKQESVEIDLNKASMVLEELRFVYGGPAGELARNRLPASGPIIVNERTSRPYLTHTFRRTWRFAATDARVPKNVKNMDSHASMAEDAEKGADSAAKPRRS